MVLSRSRVHGVPAQDIRLSRSCQHGSRIKGPQLLGHRFGLGAALQRQDVGDDEAVMGLLLGGEVAPLLFGDLAYALRLRA